MWPQRGEALDRTILAEQVVADLYAEALRRWAPAARAAALPALTAAVGDDPLPPDPDGLLAAQGVWDEIAAAVILAGLGLLWALTYSEAADALGVEPPDEAGGGAASAGRRGDPAADIVARHAGTDADDVRSRYNGVTASASASAAVSDFVDAQRRTAAAIPALVRDALSAAVNNLTVDVTTTAVEVDTEALRARTEEILDAAGPEMRDLARRQGYQAAGVMNHAVLAAAAHAGEDLEKTWICTLDGKTRPGHWAADGQRVAVKGTFTVGGEQLRFPGDPHGSPGNVLNCRCRVGVLAKDEALPDEVDRHTERLDGRDSVVINRDGRTQSEEIRRRAADGNIRARDDPDGVGQVVASGGWAASNEQEDGMDDESTTQAQTFRTWSGYIGKLGVATSDRRIMASDIDLAMREFPLPMAWQKQASGGHSDSFTVGVVEAVEVQGDRLWASGYFLNSPEADEAADQVLHQVSAPSMDLAAAEYMFTDADGNEIEGDLLDWWEENGDPFTYFTKAELTGFTLVQTPAFDGIDITLGEKESRDLAVVAAVVASVDGPSVKTYDPKLFEDPKLTRATRPTMDNATGRIYGHLAEWGHGIRGGEAVTPRNRNGYLNFHTSQVQLDNGKQLAVGRLTVEGGHADVRGNVTVATARAHYDNVCTAFGLVRVGEDRFGIWFSGVPAPGVDPEVFQMGMTAPLSGDWRDCGAGLDMIAAHAVNSPGYPIYSAATGPDGRELARVASLGPSRRAAGGGFTLDRESLKTLLAEVVDAALAARTQPAAPPPAPADRIAALFDRA